MFGLVHRGELPGKTEDEFEHLALRVQKLWLVEHNEDGSHQFDLSDYAAVEHTHDAADIVSGELDIARIPTLTKAKQHAQTAYKDESNTFSADQNVVVSTGAVAGYTARNTNAGGAIWAFGSFNDSFHITESSVSTWLTLNKTTGRLDLAGSAGIRERSRSVAMGEWASITYDAGNFFSSAGTWTVDSGDVVTLRYTLVGKTLTIAYVLAPTDLSGATAVSLHITIPFTAAARMDNAVSSAVTGGAQVRAQCYIGSGGTTLNFERNDGSNWAIGAINLTGQITLEIS